MPTGPAVAPTATGSATPGSRQFLFAFGNDEGDEATSFQGTIPQALMMMNGELMQDALSGKPGSFLGRPSSRRQRQARSPEAFMVNQIYLAALSRYPSRKELQQAGALPRHVSRLAAGAAGPVLGLAQLQRVHPDSLIPHRGFPIHDTPRSRPDRRRPWPVPWSSNP